MSKAETRRSLGARPERPKKPAKADPSSLTEERFRHLVEEINDVLFVLCEDGTIDYISPAVTALSGYRPEEMTGENFAGFVHPDDLDGLVRSFRRVVDGAVEPSEFRILHKDGSIRWVHSSSRQARLDRGVKGTRGVLTDVTERRQAEHLLRENEARFRALSETTAAITFIHRDAELIYVNPAATTVTGYTTDELLSRNFWDLIHPSMRDAARSQAQERLRGMTVPARTEVSIVTKSGEERWMDFTATMIQYEGEAAVMGTAFDITDRKRAHKALGEREKRFRALIERSSDLVTLMDERGTIRYVSPNIRRMLGYDEQELIGRDAFEPVHPDDLEAMVAVFEDLVSRPGTSALRVYRYRHKDGSWRWLEGVGTNVCGEIDGAAVIVNNRDVTDRHRAEEEARQRLAELAHVLRVGAVDEMASGLAHEINQPLGAIVNYARGALLRMDAEQHPVLVQFQQVLEEIAGQAVRASDIVRGLKRFVRKEPPRKESVDLNGLVRNVVRLVENEASELGIRLCCELAEDLPSIQGDGVQLEQVIFNLLRNGIDAIQRKGASGLLSVRTTGNGGDGLQMAIADNGDGLPADREDQIFEPFQTTKPDGLGMGLSIARTIVEAHGGRIWAEPNQGGGAVFLVTLADAGSKSNRSGSPGRL